MISDQVMPLLRRAKELLVRDGALQPAAFIWCMDGHVHPFGLSAGKGFTDKEHKINAARSVETIALQMKAYAVMTMMEANYYDADMEAIDRDGMTYDQVQAYLDQTGDYYTPTLKGHLIHREAIIVRLESWIGDWSAAQFYTKAEGKISFGTIEAQRTDFLNSAEGLFTNLCPPPPGAASA
jgi:hypothetical protein